MSDASGVIHRYLGVSVTPQTLEIWPVLALSLHPLLVFWRSFSSCHPTTRVAHLFTFRIVSEYSHSSLFPHLLSGDAPLSLSFCYLINARLARMAGTVRLVTVDLVHIPSSSRTCLCHCQVGCPGIYLLVRRAIRSLLLLHHLKHQSSIRN